ncbi:MAG: hypothetical protein V2A34_15440 [Lentisphaerota bacterium]
MKNLFKSALGLWASFLIVSSAWAGRLAPLETFEGQTGLATLTEVTDALLSSENVEGAFGIKKKWIFEKVSDGEITATLFDRQYMVKVTIIYDTEKYTIAYKDSTNLNYDGGSIHPSYNKWVAALKMSIDKTFTQVKADAANKK